MRSMSKFYELKEAATLLNRPASSLRRDCDSGAIAGVKVPWGNHRHKWMLPEEVLQQLLKTEKNQSYEDLITEWKAALRSGYCTKSRNPASEDTVKKFTWGMYYLWHYSGLDKKIENITFAAVEKAMLAATAELYDKAKEKDGYAVKECIYSAVRNLLKFMIKKGLKTEEELFRLSALKPKRSFRPKRKIIRSNHFLELVAANETLEKGRDSKGFDRECMKTILYLLGYAGLRKSEVTTLTLDDIDLENGTLNVLGKGNKRDLVGACPELCDQLEKWIAKYRPESPSRQLIVKIDGAKASEGAVRGRIRRLSKKTKIPCSPHTFRRFCATFHADRGVPLTHIQINLRHASPSTTEGYIQTDKLAAINSFRRAWAQTERQEEDNSGENTQPKNRQHNKTSRRVRY